MYGDSGVMRRRAEQLREQAVDLRSLADQLVARAESVAWSGRAADAMRERVRERAAHVRDAAARHETAADSLDRHRREVESLKETIAAVERRADALVDEARGPRATDAEPPPSGHRDWLAVELPGL